MDHFAGVPDELSVLGIASDRGMADTDAGPALHRGTAVVAVADCLSPVCRRAISLARQASLPVLLLMDGLVEWRNTLANPAAGPRFLRPAPAHAIACAGPADARTLSALGNTSPLPTGLPRLDALDPAPLLARPGPLLVATANTPWFSPEERERLTASLALLRDLLAARGLHARWRLPPALAAEVDVTADTSVLGEALRSCAAVITTPSTLMAEALLAGRPTALLHCHPTPLWQPAAAHWLGAAPSPSPPGTIFAEVPGLPEALLVRAGLHGIPSAEALDLALGSLLTPTDADLGRHAAARSLLLAEGPAAPRVAAAIRTLAAGGPHGAAPEPAPLHRAAPALRAPTPQRPRLVSMVLCDGPPLGGVPVWAQRLAQHTREHPAFPLDARTLYVATRDFPLPTAEADDARVCVIDPGLGAWHALDTVRRSLLAMEPDAVCPNYGDICHAAAALLRPAGVRTLGVMHTSDDSTERLLSAYPIFDAVLGVSDACSSVLERLFPGVPRWTAACGVPAHPAPRSSSNPGPLRLAFIGRVARLQKRADLLPALARSLAGMGTPAEMHIVGDGPDLPAVLADWRSDPPDGIRLRIHGPRDAAWVQAMLPTFDATVLLSEFEGTSMTMLESMAAGVVPAVTDVGSGIDGIVEHGRTGLVVPIGGVGEMARALTGLHRDRSLLARLGRGAWERACLFGGIDRPAGAYAEAVRTMLASPPRPTPADAGLQLAEPWRWRTHHPEDAPAAEAWIRARLREAGATDPLVLTGVPTPEALDLLHAARAAGRPAALSPGLIEPEWARLAAAVARLEREGHRRVLIIGAGDHTRRAARAFRLGLPIVGVSDDAPGADRFEGLPLVRTAEALTLLDPDAAVLSSDAWEDALRRSACGLAAAGVRIVPLYGREAAEAGARGGVPGVIGSGASA